MPDQVRIYQGNTVQSAPLEQDKPLSFGENKKCDYCFPQGSCPGNSVAFSVQNGVWTVACEGTVTCAGKRVTTAQARNGDNFILNEELALAVQFVHQENRPMARISLMELPELLVGRSANCTLQLNHMRVSGSHAKFYPQRRSVAPVRRQQHKRNLRERKAYPRMCAAGARCDRDRAI